MATEHAALHRAEERINRQAATTASSVFAARAINGLAELMGETEAEALAEATSAPSDIDVLFRALVKFAEAKAAAPDSPLLAARIRGLQMREDLLKAAGGVLPVSEVARTLKVSRQAVDKRRKMGQLHALDLGKRGYLYPACQFDNRKILEGLSVILPVMRHHSPWSILRFLVNGNARLGGRSPIEALREGAVEPVRVAALQFLEHGAA